MGLFRRKIALSRANFVHIATVTPLWENMHGAGRQKNMDDYDFTTVFSELEAEEKKQRSKTEIVDLLRTEGEKFAAFVDGLSDEILAEEFTESGGAVTKTRFESLLSAKSMRCIIALS